MVPGELELQLEVDSGHNDGTLADLGTKPFGPQVFQCLVNNFRFPHVVPDEGEVKL